ncbi:MAG: hypothetical protein AAF583_07950 [Pseudomonadota bacterium]
MGIICIVAMIHQMFFSGETDGFWFRLYMFVFGAGMGLVILFQAPFQRFIFDRDEQMISRTRWFLWRRFDDTMPMENVAAIRQKMEVGTHQKGPSRAEYYIMLDYVSDDGSVESVKLSKVGTDKKRDKVITRLNEWLTRPD